jgi:DNA-binding MarR family transcriptional regulator
VDRVSRSSDEELRFAVQRLARAMRRHRGAGLSDTQLAVLFHLDGGECFPGELAARENVAPPTINRTLNGLESAGLVARRPSPDDARRVLVRLTPTGRAALAETRRLREAWFAGRLSTLSDDERARLNGVAPLLHRLAAE